MVKKTNTTASNCDETRVQLLSRMKAVELVPSAKSYNTSFITVHIGNCTMRIMI